MRGSKVWIATDGSQARGSTKQQLQSLKMLRESGGQIRICCGNSVGAAYEEDRRSVKVGGKLRGLHHSKTMLVRFFPDLRARSVSLDRASYTIKANAESGAFLRLSRCF